MDRRVYPRQSRRTFNLSAIFEDQPKLFYQNPYINFLREFRLKRLHYPQRQLYHEATIAWNRLSDKEKRSYLYRDVIRDINRRQAITRKKFRQLTMPNRTQKRLRRRVPTRKVKGNYRRKLYSSRLRTKRLHEEVYLKRLRNAFKDVFHPLHRGRRGNVRRL